MALLPAGSLVAFLALTALSTIAVRGVAADLDFLVQRRLVLVIAATGLIVSFVAYGVSCAAAFRTLSRLGQLSPSGPALWILAATGMVTALPVLIAVLWPQ